MKCEDPEVIKGWFDLIQKLSYNLDLNSDDVYNFDKTEVSGRINGMTARVVTEVNTRRRALL